jgi:hypothetical protein
MGSASGVEEPASGLETVVSCTFFYAVLDTYTVLFTVELDAAALELLALLFWAWAFFFAEFFFLAGILGPFGSGDRHSKSGYALRWSKIEVQGRRKGREGGRWSWSRARGENLRRSRKLLYCDAPITRLAP